MKTNLKHILIALIFIFLYGCSINNNVVNNNFISPRKYTKGFNIRPLTSLFNSKTISINHKPITSIDSSTSVNTTVNINTEPITLASNIKNNITAPTIYNNNVSHKISKPKNIIIKLTQQKLQKRLNAFYVLPNIIKPDTTKTTTPPNIIEKIQEPNCKRSFNYLIGSLICGIFLLILGYLSIEMNLTLLNIAYIVPFVLFFLLLFASLVYSIIGIFNYYSNINKYKGVGYGLVFIWLLIILFLAFFTKF